MRIIKKFTLQNKINSYSLEKCAQYFEIETNKDRLHSGTYDTEICARLLIKLFDKYNVDEKTHITVYSTNLIENCIKNINLHIPNSTNSALYDKSTNSNPYTIFNSEDRSAKDIRTGLLTKMDDSKKNNFGGYYINDKEFQPLRDLSASITDFDNLNLVYTNSKATTNTLKPIHKNNEIVYPGLDSKDDERMKNLTEMNRSYVINTTNKLNDIDNNKKNSLQEFNDRKTKDL